MSCLTSNYGRLAQIAGETNQLIYRDGATLAFGTNFNGRYTAELAYRNHNELNDLPSPILSSMRERYYYLFKLKYFGKGSAYFSHAIRNNLFVLAYAHSDHDSL